MLSVQFLSLFFVRTNKHYLSPGTYNCIIEMSTKPKIPARPANGFVGFSPELIYYNGLNIGGKQKHMKILLSMAKICD